jgi:hypothetical protein
MFRVKLTQRIGGVYSATWQKVDFGGLNTIVPYPRTSHTCVTYLDRYLVVIGGETEDKNIPEKALELAKSK